MQQEESIAEFCSCNHESQVPWIEKESFVRSCPGILLIQDFQQGYIVLYPDAVSGAKIRIGSKFPAQINK